MRSPTQQRLTLGISWIAGLIDSSTGIGLIFLPSFTLKLMGLHESSYSLPYIQFIGAFVLGIGSLYLWGLGFTKRQSSWIPLRYAWMATGWTRILVGMTTGILILKGTLLTTWVSVPLTDLSVGFFQLLWILSNRFPLND